MTIETQIANFHVIDAERQIFRGGQPRTPDDWLFLRDFAKVERVIKLNEDSEGDDNQWTQWLLELMKVQISVVQQIVTEPDFSYLGAAVEWLGPRTYVHCTHGKDRTGLVVALWRLTRGWTIEDAEAEWKRYGGDEWCLPGLEKAWFDLAPYYRTKYVASHP
jgi:hypothetical protein